MAKLPFFVAGGQVQTGQPVLARAPQSNPLGELGQGVGQFVEKQKQIEEQREAIEVSKEIANLKADWTERFLKGQESAEDGAAGFTANLMGEYEKDVKTRLSKFSPRAQAFFEERATNYRTALLSDATGFEAKARGDKAARDVTETINTHINSVRSNPNLYEGSIQEIGALIKAAPLPPALRAKLFTDAKEQATTAAVLARSDRDPAGALKALQAGEYDSGLSPKAKSSLINNVEVDIRQRRAEARAQAAEGRALRAEQEREAEKKRLIEIAKFEVGVRDGKGSRERIDALWNDGQGKLKPHEYVELTSLQARADAERAKADAGIAKVNAALVAGIGLDYKNTDDKKAVDLHFQQTFAPGLAGLDAETQASAVVNHSDKIGMVPESVQSAMRVNLRNGNTEQVVKASDFVARLQERNPQLLNDFSKDEIAMGTMVTDRIRAGVDPKMAVQQVRDAMNVPESTKDERKIRFKEAKLADKIPDLLKREFSNTFSRNPEVGDPAYGEFRRLFESYYTATGDADSSEKAAAADMKRVWGESNVNGKKQLMKYAPEKFYSIGGESDYIRKQALADVAPLVPEKVRDSVSLVSDSRTAREAATGRPTYALMYQDEQGRILPVFKDGVAQRFAPDPSKLIEEKKAKALQQGQDRRSDLEMINKPLPSVDFRREQQRKYEERNAPR